MSSAASVTTEQDLTPAESESAEALQSDQFVVQAEEVFASHRATAGGLWRRAYPRRGARPGARVFVARRGWLTRGALGVALLALVVAAVALSTGSPRGSALPKSAPPVVRTWAARTPKAAAARLAIAPTRVQRVHAPRRIERTRSRAARADRPTAPARAPAAPARSEASPAPAAAVPGGVQRSGGLFSP